MVDHDDVARGRRRFLQQSLAFIPLATVVGRGVAPLSAQAAPAQGVSPGPVPLWFNPREWRFIIAACGRLIPEDALGPGAVSEGVPVFIDRQMEQPYGHGQLWYMQPPFAEAIPELGYQSPLVPREIYRGGIAAIDQHCQQHEQADFADLKPRQQDALLTQLEAGELNFSGLPGALFFTQLLDNTKEGYLADPQHGGNQTLASWTLIGFPGARADYQDQMDNPNKPYPLPPVSISGYRGRSA